MAQVKQLVGSRTSSSPVRPNATNSMRVWLFQIGEPLPWQKNRRVMRSGRVAKELIRRGHEVIWWTNRFDHYTKTWLRPGSEGADENGIQYRLLSGIGYRNNYSPLRFIDHWLVARH